MFGLGFSEMLVIMLVALVAIGPKRLPGVAKALGRGIAEFRNAMDEMRATVYKEVHEPIKKSFEDTPALKETSAEYLDRLLAQREKERAETEAKANAAYAQASAPEPPEEPKPADTPETAQGSQAKEPTAEGKA